MLPKKLKEAEKSVNKLSNIKAFMSLSLTRVNIWTTVHLLLVLIILLALNKVQQIWHFCFPCKFLFLKKKEYPHLSTTLRYRLLSRGSFESTIFSRRLSLAVALDRWPAWRRIPSLNHLSTSYTLAVYVTRNQYASSWWSETNSR